MEPTGWGYGEIGWLLEQVRSAGGDIPPRYDPADDSPDALKGSRKARLDFGRSIFGAFSWHRSHGELTSDARAKRRVRSLVALRGQVARLQRALDGDYVLRRKLSDAIGRDDGVGLHEISQGLHRLGKAAHDLATGMDDAAPWPGLSMTALELLSDRLAKAYRKGLDANPLQDSTTSYHDPRGPFVAFVRAAHQLAGESPPSATALETALAIARKSHGSGEE